MPTSFFKTVPVLIRSRGMKGAALCLVLLVTLTIFSTVNSGKLTKSSKLRVARRRSLDQVVKSSIKRSNKVTVPELNTQIKFERKTLLNKEKGKRKTPGDKAKKVNAKYAKKKRKSAKLKSSLYNTNTITPASLELKGVKVLAKNMPKKLEEDEISRNKQRLGCGKCVWQECPPVNAMKRYCPSGITRDKCGCCAQCASSVGMRCYLTYEGQPWLPPCGDDLECIPALEGSDIDPHLQTIWGARVTSEGLCSCTNGSPVCGSDDVTYDNACELREASMRTAMLSNVNISISHRGPCRTAPKIDSPPVDVSAVEGSVVSFRCETSGFPLPRVQWIKKSANSRDGRKEELPGYLNHAVTQMRGGPGKYQLTTWLTLDRAKESDNGVYVCRSSNHYGIANGQATLRISPK